MSPATENRMTAPRNIPILPGALCYLAPKGSHAATYPDGAVTARFANLPVNEANHDEDISMPCFLSCVW
jgi:hypothetical protein